MLGVASPAVAAPRSELSNWFCASLKRPFDPDAAFGSFPLEALGDAVETRTTHAFDSVFGPLRYVVVSRVAQGNQYKIEYRYQFDPDDVSARRGYTLSLSPVQAPAMRDLKETEARAKNWLSEFGRPEKDQMGWRVGAGPLAIGRVPVFHFTGWVDGTLAADWSVESDLKYASDLCKPA